MPRTAIPALPWRPDPGTPTPPATPEPTSALDTAWTWITGAYDAIPTWIWVAFVGTLFLASLVTFPMLRVQAFKAGARASKKRDELSDEDRQDRKLLIAALVPAVLFWAAVLVGSGRGLTAFGEDDLKWTGGWQFLVPLTLDGVAISFGLLAFRAVKKGIDPDRATRIAWAAMLASAGLNFFHEVGGSSLGAVYLAILSILGMLIFHEFLAQFEEGAAYIARQNPKFGLRWFTWPANTLCAWFAWRNYPPQLADGDRATVRMAVEHLRQVRLGKALKRARSVDAPEWWIKFVPWLRTEQFTTALGELRTKLGVERKTRTRIEANHQTTVTDLNRVLEANRTEIARLTAELTRTTTEARTEAANQAAQFAAERADWDTRVTAVRADLDAVTRDRDENAVRLDELGRRLNQHTEQAATERRTAEVNQQLAAQRFDAERTARTTSEAAAQQARTAADENADRLLALVNQERDRNADLAEENAALREALVQGNVSPLRLRRTGSGAGSPGRTTALMDDGSALAQMFEAHPEPGFVWSAQEARRVTRAGLSGRAKRLAEAANQHDTECAEPNHKGCFTRQTQTA